MPSFEVQLSDEVVATLTRLAERDGITPTDVLKRIVASECIAQDHHDRKLEREQAGLCGLCGKPMPEGEEMFKYHGYSGPCPTDEPADNPES